MSKIKQDIDNIKLEFLTGRTIEDISKFYKVSRKCIEDLLSGRTFKGVGKVKELDNRAAGRKVVIQFNDVEVTFGNVRQVAKLFGLSESSVSNMIAGRHPYPVIKNIKTV